MAKALGVGGVFFTSPDPKALNVWYQRALGFEPGGIFLPKTMPENGCTVWNVKPANTEYFSPSTRGFMINLVVDNVDEALKQVRSAGGQLVGNVESTDYGRFGWFVDPDGNKVELWEPK